MSTTHHTLAFIGLGRMGAAMSTHLAESGYTVHGFDVSEDARAAMEGTGVVTHESIADCVGALPNPKIVWLMVPSKFVDDVLESVQPHITAGDCVIDGGNSFFKKSIFRHQTLEEYKIDYIDCGTSGGVDGARTGASLMVGGDTDAVKAHEHIFTTLAAENGYGFVGGPGAGHFVKMVHNGIEYGMMGAIAEGINTLNDHRDGLGINIPEALKAYEHGSIIESNLMSWLARAYEDEQALETIAGNVPHGETEMEMEYLVDHNHLRVLNAALTQRKLTRSEPSFTGTLIAAIRNQFGGHAVKRKEKQGAASDSPKSEEK